MLEVAYVSKLCWPGDRALFIKLCGKLAKDIRQRLCIVRTTVYLWRTLRTLPDCGQHDYALACSARPAALMVPWRKHHDTRIIAEFRRASLNIPKLRTLNGRRLRFCWLYFAFLPAQLYSALQDLRSSKCNSRITEHISPAGVATLEPSGEWLAKPKSPEQRFLKPNEPPTLTDSSLPSTPQRHRPVWLAQTQS